jgi:hypothetical protein
VMYELKGLFIVELGLLRMKGGGGRYFKVQFRISIGSDNHESSEPGEPPHRP